MSGDEQFIAEFIDELMDEVTATERGTTYDVVRDERQALEAAKEKARETADTIIDLGATHFVDQIVSRTGLRQELIIGLLQASGIEPMRRRPNQKLPPAKALKQHVDDGLTLIDIAKEYGCTVPAVSQSLKRAGLSANLRKTGPQRPLPPAEELLALVHVERVTDIARRFGVSISSVSDALRRAGFVSIERVWTDPTGVLPTASQIAWAQARVRYFEEHPPPCWSDLVTGLETGSIPATFEDT
jgi:hypothetical protein